MPGEISVQGGGTPRGSRGGLPRVGAGESPCGVTRPLGGGSMQLSSPEHKCVGSFMRLRFVLCHSESCFWDTLALLAVPSLCYCHDNWFHASDSLNSGM